jgi:hypothetical protein
MKRPEVQGTWWRRLLSLLHEIKKINKMRKDEVSLSKTRAHGRTLSPIKQRKGVDEMSMDSPM